MLVTIVASLLAACTSTSPSSGGSGGGSGGGHADSGATTDGGGVAGDGGGSSDGGMMDPMPCDETVVPLTKATPPVSVDEVWPVVQAWVPTPITWVANATADDVGTSDALSVVIEQTGDAMVVTRTGYTTSDTDPDACRPGPELRIPVTATVTVAGGQAVATHTGFVDAQAAERTRIYFTDLVDEAPVLSKDWQAAAASKVSGWGYSIDDATRLYATIVTSQTDDVWAPEWAIDVRRDEAPMWGGVLWRGTLDE